MVLPVGQEQKALLNSVPWQQVGFLGPAVGLGGERLEPLLSGAQSLVAEAGKEERRGYRYPVGPSGQQGPSWGSAALGSDSSAKEEGEKPAPLQKVAPSSGCLPPEEGIP